MQRLKALPILLIVVGGTIMILAFVADKLGYGDSGSFGIGQLLLALVSLILLLIGLLGKRFFKLYQAVATIFLNTLILLALLELGAIIIGRSYFQVKHTGIQYLPYYAAQDWTKVYWQEANLTQGYHYQSYVVWRHLPFVGKTININQEGIRQTPGAECGTGAYKVFALGGSTLLGWGSPDWGTIPAYLQEGLETSIEGPVCVINLGEDGYNSTQSLVALILQLQSGNIPDGVIFYDGVNEVIAAYESGQPSVHVTLAKIAAKFEEQEHPLITWGKATRTYALIKSWDGDNLEQKRRGNGPEEILSDSGQELNTHNLADSVTKVYLSNYRMVSMLAQEYGFDYFFFLQPHLAVGQKALTNEEQIMRSRMDPALVDLAKAIYGNIALVTSDYEHLWYIADGFGKEDKQIWIDEVGHITPEGNRLVAQEMLAIIENQLATK
jgi:hypothetical protein